MSMTDAPPGETSIKPEPRPFPPPVPRPMGIPPFAGMPTMPMHPNMAGFPMPPAWPVPMEQMNFPHGPGFMSRPPEAIDASMRSDFSDNESTPSTPPPLSSLLQKNMHCNPRSVKNVISHMNADTDLLKHETKVKVTRLRVSEFPFTELFADNVNLKPNRVSQ